MKTTRAGMNWARGLFRLWFVLSILWIAIWAIAMRPDQELTRYNESYAEAKALANDLRQSALGDDPTELQTALLWDKKERLRRADSKVQSSHASFMAFLAIGPGVAAGFLVFGAALLWALRGFRSQSQ